jgi:hypothetical protein
LPACMSRELPNRRSAPQRLSYHSSRSRATGHTDLGWARGALRNFLLDD